MKKRLSFMICALCLLLFAGNAKSEVIKYDAIGTLRCAKQVINKETGDIDWESLELPIKGSVYVSTEGRIDDGYMVVYDITSYHLTIGTTAIHKYRSKGNYIGNILFAPVDFYSHIGGFEFNSQSGGWAQFSASAEEYLASDFPLPENTEHMSGGPPSNYVTTTSWVEMLGLSDWSFEGGGSDLQLRNGTPVSLGCGLE